MLDNLVLKVRTIREFVDRIDEIYDSDALCVFRDGEEFSESYHTFADKIRSAANYFSHKYGFGKRFFVMGDFNERWLTVFLGIAYSGNIIVPMDRTLSTAQLKECCERVEADVMLFGINVEKSKEDELVSAFPHIASDHIDSIYAETSDICFDSKVSYIGRKSAPDDDVILIFTSGTTGANKIVQLTNRNICADTALCSEVFEDEFVPDDRILTILPTHHMFAITANLFYPLLYGMTLCIGGGIRGLNDDMIRFQPHLIMLVPLVVEGFSKKIDMLLGRTDENVPLTDEQKSKVRARFGKNLKALICGGAPLSANLVKKFERVGVSLRNGYGITECSPVISCNTRTRSCLGSVGAVNNMTDVFEVKIIDDEICVKGEIVSPGYYKDERSNSIAFKDGWFRTGDIGKIENGYLFITGRKKNVVILSDGNNFVLDDIESSICESPLVNSAIINCKECNGNYVLEAIINPAEGHIADDGYIRSIDELIKGINESNPRYMRISSYKFIETDFERTSLGKIKKFRYEQM